MKTCLQIIVLSLLSNITLSQNGFTPYTSISISSFNSSISALMVDNIGVKWIGFKSNSLSLNSGLLKHDGVSFSFYNSTSTPAFNSFSVTAINQDALGNIWIGSELGLTKFNGTTFITYNTTNGLPTNFVKCIEVVGNLIYVGTNNGLSRFDGVNFTNYNVANGKLPNDTVTCIEKESATLLLLGGINRLTNFNFSVSSTTSSFSTQLISPSTGAINCIFIDATNTKWLGTSLVGVIKYNSSSFTNIKTIYEVNGSFIPNKVIDICLGANNGIAFKTNVTSLINSYSKGIIELCDNKKVYQYYPNTTNFVGDYVEHQSGNIVFSNVNLGLSNIYGIFNKSLHFTFDANISSDYSSVTSNNFKYLDINSVKAGITNKGDMHRDFVMGGSSYEVPKGTGKHSNFTSALWIGGYDAGGQLYQSSQTYRQNDNQYWPGPLDTISAFADVYSANNFDHIWKVSYTDINDFIVNYNNGNLASGAFVPTQDILTWPAQGTGNYAKQLAPFVDHNGDGIYNPYQGDYPKIKGDQALYYIFNNNLFGHGPNTCNNMGLEIHAMAYAYGCPTVLSGKPELNLTTFYDYKIINRSNKNYHDVYIGLFNDFELGDPMDDYSGSNVSNNFGYAYNGDNYDGIPSSFIGYGNYLPAQGYAILKGPIANSLDGLDNDNDGIIDEINEECKLNKSVYFNNSFPGTSYLTTDPTTCYQAYNYLTGKWKDGTSFTCGGNAYGGTITTNWVFPGDPTLPGVSTDPANTCGYWIESALPGDRRLSINSGPFSLNAGQMQEVEYAFVTSFDSSIINNNLIAVTKLKSDVIKINNFYNLINKPTCFLTVGVNELLKQDDFYVFPNPTSETLSIRANIEGVHKLGYEIFDVLGKSILKNEVNDVSTFNVNVSEFKSGIYFMRLQIKDSFIVKKFIKN